VEIVYQDNGIGIDLEKYGTQVFGLYKRFHHHADGKGLGLYMVKTQVEALNGTITIESRVNEGTRFNIQFPNV
jgi:signal transduction histidine kinase